MSLATLRDRLAKLHESEPERKVRIRADHRLAWGQVRDAMKAVAGSGYENAGLIAEKEERPR